MERRIRDILPPQEKSLKPSFFKKRGKEEKEEVDEPRRIKPPKRGGGSGKKIIVILALIIILAFSIAFFTLGKAKIEIWPKGEVKNFEITLTVDRELNNEDFGFWVNNNVIPGKKFLREKTVTGNFPATGKSSDAEKARGTITVFNEYSTSPQILIASTRFVSTDGKVFRTPVKVTVPGGASEGGDFAPGQIDVEVVADEPGPEYNIGPTTFSIPGFAGTARYTKFYAKSSEPMKGGTDSELSLVTKEDLKEAENKLVEKAKAEAKASLMEELKSESFSSEFYFLEDAIQTLVIEKFSLTEEGEAAEEFKFQAKANSETLIFKKEDIKNFVKEFIGRQTTEDQVIYEEKLNIEYSVESIDLASGKIVLSLTASAEVYSNINLPILKDNLKGKSLFETKFFLENRPEIVDSNVNFSPFWVRKVPEDEGKIDIELRFSP